MRATVWGSRGSLATSGPDQVRYGGQTSCVEVRTSDDEVIILDAGTGIRPLGAHLQAEGVGRVHLFLSHLHLDHLQGLAFFGPLWQPGSELHVWGPPSSTKSLEERIGAYMGEPLFPVNVSDVPCTAYFHDADEDGVQVGSATVYGAAVAHRGPTIGYRIEDGGSSLAYLPDHEPAIGGDLRRQSLLWISGYGLAAGADVLFHDGQYTEQQYPLHVGWGHSSTEHVVTFARRAGVQQLVLFHHDPRHTDDELDVIGTRACELWGEEGNPPLMAHDGMHLDVARMRSVATA